MQSQPLNLCLLKREVLRLENFKEIFTFMYRWCICKGLRISASLNVVPKVSLFLLIPGTQKVTNQILDKQGECNDLLFLC